eukprot:CAMPEP_0177598062 /NCGR_PEP_ID=MMETSP0419_2-20121207/12104_1 /TAXON_ID=582737 /ORGANISM="Tetraselmis sp., Strain GSL018" /LENGTH=540 /DNA_ID=CAMNT_0019090393 /DNA_START=280 /DNA_END=1903 /DNA_ORIENTATION=+
MSFPELSYATTGRLFLAALSTWVVLKITIHHQFLQECVWSHCRLSPSFSVQENELLDLQKNATVVLGKAVNLHGSSPANRSAWHRTGRLPPNVEKILDAAKKAVSMGTKRRVLVVEDGECKYRPPKVVRHCATLDTAYGHQCSGWGFDSHYHHGYVAAFRALEQHMARVGVPNYRAVRFDSEKAPKMIGDAEVIITSAAMVPKLLEMSQAQFVVVERADSASVVEDNFYGINNPRVIAVLKHTSLHPLSRNNDDLLLHGRHHYVQIDPSLAPSARKRAPPFSPAALRKVHVMVPQVFRFRNPTECGGKRHYLHLAPAFQPNATIAPAGGNGTAQLFIRPLANRSIDIAFLGGFQNHESLKKHRSKAAAAIRAVASRHPRLNVVAGFKKTETVAEFYELLRDVKFFVSPYGYGEFANKDYEAVLSGCVLVKPLAHQLTAFPNIYKPGVSAVSVAGDFSDLGRVVLPLLKSLPKAQAIADSALGQLRKFSHPGILAEHLSMLLDEVAEALIPPPRADRCRDQPRASTALWQTQWQGTPCASP